MKQTTRAAFAAALTVGLVGTLLTAATAAAPERLDLGDLPRGASVAVPYLENGTVVDGALRVVVPRRVTLLLGRSGDDYLVVASPRGGDNTLLRVAPDGSRSVVLRSPDLFGTRLSPDGTTLAHAVVTRQGRTRLRTLDTTTGAVTGTRTIRGFGNLLDFDGDRVAVGLNAPNRTVVWTPATDGVARISRAAGYRADLAGDRLAVHSEDPFEGGCTVVSTFADPGTELWRSCRERVEAWSTDGSRMATVDILADGLGPSRTWLRRTGGRLLGVYDAPYYFGRVGFEDATHLLVDTYGRTTYAVVRCDGGDDCERAGRIHAHQAPLHATG